MAAFYKQPGEIYLDGNSLGLLSRPGKVERVLFHTGGWHDTAPLKLTGTDGALLRAILEVV